MRKFFGINLDPYSNQPKTATSAKQKQTSRPQRGSTTVCPADPGGYPPGRGKPINNQVVVNITDVMRLCWLIHKYGKTEGIPKVVDGYCEGYQADETNDEPCESCKECKFNQSYEE